MSVATVIDLLGGSRVLGRGVTTEGALRGSLQRGLPYAALEALQRSLQLSDAEIATTVDIHPRTLARRRRQRRLLADESDRLSRVARIGSLAVSVLGGEANAVAWLRQPNQSLAGDAPLRLLATDIGSRRVEAVLTHIEWGDVS